MYLVVISLSYIASLYRLEIADYIINKVSCKLFWRISLKELGIEDISS